MPQVTTTIHDILDELRAGALDERDKGDKFEQLMQGYLRTDPEWALQFSEVWLWSKWPGRQEKPEWIMDRYQIKSDKPSGIVNDPNDWSRGHVQPRYIIDLLKRIATVSVETMKIVDILPKLDIVEGE